MLVASQSWRVAVLLQAVAARAESPTQCAGHQCKCDIGSCNFACSDAYGSPGSCCIWQQKYYPSPAGGGCGGTCIIGGSCTCDASPHCSECCGGNCCAHDETCCADSCRSTNEGECCGGQHWCEPPYYCNGEGSCEEQPPPSPSPPSPPPPPPQQSSMTWLQWGVPTAVAVILLIIGGGVLTCKHRARMRAASLQERLLVNSAEHPISVGLPTDLEGVSPSLKALQAEELMRATQGWSEEVLLGAGGFGKVYRIDSLESLPRAGQCAVKRLDSEAMQGTAELLTEIQVLGTCRHECVLPLLGFCVHPRSPCLVYPLMCGGNLDDRIMLSAEARSRLRALRPSMPQWPALPWTDRLRILRDATRAISYLHTPIASTTNPKDAILHRDIKPSNILLDEHLNAKLGDVGLARQAHELEQGRTHLSTSKVVGTHGYIDPLYTQTGRFSQVTDNYALGMTILVALVARPAQEAISECEELLEDPSLAPPHADEAALWPQDVAVELAAVVKGLTYARTSRNRVSLASTLQQLEALCERVQDVPAGLIIPPSDEGDVRECVVCMANLRTVRFGCGHFCCCTECSDMLRDQRMGCPNCRAPIATTADAASNEPTFVAVGQPLTAVGEE